MPKKQKEKKQKEKKKILTREEKKELATKKSLEVIEIIHNLNEQIEKNIDDIKAKNKAAPRKGKTTGVKKWTSAHKIVGILEKKIVKCLKNYKAPTTKRNNNNSGISKPIKISNELRTFINEHINDLDNKELLKIYDPKKDVSRTFVTKFMCKYVKAQNLQNPDDKKSILNGKDGDFDAVVYKFVPVNKAKPLTFFSMQTNLKGHYTKVPEKVKNEVKKKKKNEEKKKTPEDNEEENGKKDSEKKKAPEDEEEKKESSDEE